MPVLEWDKVGERVYDTGLDRGVLYLPDGSGVAWNGLVSISEIFDKEVEAIYYDGRKINDLVSLGSFSATMTAMTYPDEFAEIEGLESIKRGVLLGDQPPKLFNLCYRTQVGNDVDGPSKNYKIHLIYNITAIPSDRVSNTISADVGLTLFEWNLTTIPEQVSGYHPTSHIIVNSGNIDPFLLEDIEEILYGSSISDAFLIPMDDLSDKINEWYRVKIVDNGDGTWTATSLREDFIHFYADSLFDISGVNAVYPDDWTFLIGDTYDVLDAPAIKIDDGEDGTWTASTDHSLLIDISDDGLFDIQNANAVYLGPDTYRISDTLDD
jgi:hypothetical protein